MQAGEVNCEAFVNLYQDPDAESLFTAPEPDGLSFNKLMFKGSLKTEMQKLLMPQEMTVLMPQEMT